MPWSREGGEGLEEDKPRALVGVVSRRTDYRLYIYLYIYIRIYVNVFVAAAAVLRVFSRSWMGRCVTAQKPLIYMGVHAS